MSNEGKFKFNITQAVLTLVSIILIAIGVYSISMNSADIGSNNRGSRLKEGARVYDKYAYYENDKKSRYESFGVRKPDMDPSEVVWRVNANLDLPFYTKVVTITDFTPPVLVNKYRRLPDDFEPKGLANTSSGQIMTYETKTAYEALRDAASEHGYHISAISGYKSIDYQKGYYNKMVLELGKEEADRQAPRAGFSELHLGTAIELSANGTAIGDASDTPEAIWVAENAHLFGFIVRYTKDNQDVTGYDPRPGLVVYVGTEVAEDMHRLGINSLEEYYAKYLTH